MTRINPSFEEQPILRPRHPETQLFGTLKRSSLGLSHEARLASVEALNRVLADTMTIRDLYKKHHWQVSGPTFYELHRMFDEHASQQNELADALAERIQMLGGVAVALGLDVFELSQIERAPKGREEVPAQLSRLLDAHEKILVMARRFSREASALGDDGTADLVVSEVVRTNESQAWFLTEHAVDTPLVQPR